MISSISLIGMPGAGKSVVGKSLAGQLGWDFVDTDRLIERRVGSTLQRFLEDAGYLAVRQAEEDTILSLQQSKCVVATGGSAVYSQRGMAHLNNLSTLVFLDVDLATVVKRVKNFSERGIACAKNRTLDEIYEERYPLYQHYADFTLPNSAQKPEDAVQSLLDYIKKAQSST